MIIVCALWGGLNVGAWACAGGMRITHVMCHGFQFWLKLIIIVCASGNVSVGAWACARGLKIPHVPWFSISLDRKICT